MSDEYVKSVSFNHDTDPGIIALANEGARSAGCSVAEFVRRVLTAELPRYAPNSNINSVL